MTRETLTNAAAHLAEAQANAEEMGSTIREEGAQRFGAIRRSIDAAASAVAAALAALDQPAE